MNKTEETCSIYRGPQAVLGRAADRKYENFSRLPFVESHETSRANLEERGNNQNRKFMTYSGGR